MLTVVIFYFQKENYKVLKFCVNNATFFEMKTFFEVPPSFFKLCISLSAVP